MAIPKETLKAMIRDFGGYELTDSELDLVAPELEAYMAEASRLHELDISTVLSSGLLRAEEGGHADE